jgi:tRNA-2-methylthio-N6-dimethylallyladenosine synthase
VEGPADTDKDTLTGRTRSNKIVNFKGKGLPRCKVVDVKILRAKRHSLEGEAV